MITIDLKKFINFVIRIYKYIINLFKTPTTMTDQRQTMNAYNDAIEAKADLDLAVQTAQANLKPYQDALDLAIKAQYDNASLSEGLKAQIISDLVPVIPTVISDQSTPVVPAPETDIVV